MNLNSYVRISDPSHVSILLFIAIIQFSFLVVADEDAYKSGKKAYYQKDYLKAHDWFEKAAQNGVAGAELMLGVMYHEGMGVKPDPNVVMHWYLKAAEKNIPEAHVNLGNMYLKGHGVHQSYEKAAQWYASAAALGDAGAQDNLGVMYMRGDGVPKDPKKAYELFKSAAEENYVGAQYHLGNMYADGDAIPQDYARALAWLNIAAVQGHGKTRGRQSQLVRKMTPQQRAEAQRLTNELLDKIL